jgi:hypothetical protein
MGDQLEKFMLAHRDAFEVDAEVDADTRWQKIESRIYTGRSKDFSLYWKMAAVLFLLSTAFLLVDRFQTEQKLPISSRHEEFVRAEAFYTQLIEEKRVEIASFKTETLSGEFVQEIEQLDHLYTDLKETFNSNVNDDKIIDAMINNLQLRIEILNQQLNILKTLNKVENEKLQSV